VTNDNTVQLGFEGNSGFIPEVTVVVPTFNEAENVLPLTKRVSEALDKLRVELFFIDDSPNDGTSDKVKLAQQQYDSETFQIRLNHRVGDDRKSGLSGAVVAGIQDARSDLVIVMDGDLQHPPETIPAILAAALVEGHDVVVASRYCQGGSAEGLDGGIRHLVSRGSTILAKVSFPWRLRRVSDPMTGFFLIRRSSLDLGRLRPKGFKILLEILATQPGLSVAEVPLQFAERANGESNGSLKQGLTFLSQLLGLKLKQLVPLFDRLPKFVQFGAIGGSVFVLGMVLLTVLVEKLGWSPLVANALQLILTFWLNYLLNRRITWRERNVTRLAAHKFLFSRAVTTVLNYGLFALLTSVQLVLPWFGHALTLRIHYLVANIITLIAMTIINFVTTDRWAFAEAAAPVQRMRKGRPGRRWAFRITSVVLLITFISIRLRLSASLDISILLALAGVVLFAQASLEVWRMVYTYREPEAVDRLNFPAAKVAREKFCLIVPARHEVSVLATTLHQLARQTHPKVTIVAIICDDDYETLRVAYKVAELESNVRVIQYPLRPGTKPSKPLQLNYVLEQTKSDKFSVFGVFDAEDTVYPELMMHIDSAFRDREVGVVQGGVQLMNHDSSWYSLHNVLEYYRWFNRAMAYQADKNFMPLGGNTIFIRTSLLRKAGGWPVTLTEDCSLGVLLSTRFQAQTAVYYDPKLATREETPDTLQGLFRQRVRWNQGFLHEWRRGIWQELPNWRQRFFACYVLLGPLILAAISLFMIVSVCATIFLHAQVGLVLFMYLPIVPVALLGILNGIFLYDFGKAYNRKIRLHSYFILFGTQFVYQQVLNVAALWAVVRELRGNQTWYKTAHAGQHRSQASLAADGIGKGVEYASGDNK
jgi:cellulose synthase/poly-beta-1,6-N-acetylglucosamine synthase-like glycosyltransferase/putative flippase GtrA